MIARLFNQWRLPIILGFIVLIGAFLWNHGYQKGRGEVSKYQAQVDKANIENTNLKSDMAKVNEALRNTQNKSQIEIDEWKAKHKDVKPQPASKCVGKADYFGEEEANKFMQQFNRQGAEMLND